MNKVADLWRFAEASNHEIHTNPDLGKYPEFTGAVNYISMGNDEDFGFIAEFPDRIIFSIRGTRNLQAWVGDVDAYPLRDPHADDALVNTADPTQRGIIHKDFYKAWLIFKQPFQDYLYGYVKAHTGLVPDKKHRLGEIWKEYKLPPIFYTGHSRGGAISPIAARDAAKNLGLTCSLITFGAPRVGTSEFRDEINALPIDYLNIHHGSEFTQDLPPEWLGFRHAGRLMLLEEPFWHKFFNKISDHFYSTTTDAIVRYCKTRNDTEGAAFLQKYVRPRVNI